MDWKQRCAELQKRIAELEAENRDLRQKLGMPIPSPVQTAFLWMIPLCPIRINGLIFANSKR